jgi:hypothetical protein
MSADAQVAATSRLMQGLSSARHAPWMRLRQKWRTYRTIWAFTRWCDAVAACNSIGAIRNHAGIGVRWLSQVTALIAIAERAACQSILHGRCADAAKADNLLAMANSYITMQIDLRAPEEVLEFGQAPVLAGATMFTHKRKCVTCVGPVVVCPMPCGSRCDKCVSLQSSPCC